METIENLFPWLELMDRPAFCAKDHVVIAVNSSAKHRNLQVGTDIHHIITDNWETYADFESGTLYTTATISGLPCPVCVTRTKEYDIFTVSQQEDTDSLQALALAAQQLRIPLSNVMTVTDRLLSNLEKTEQHTQQANQINRGLYQLLRIVSNMSDSGETNIPFAGMQTVNLTAVFGEMMEKISATVDAVSIAYEGPDKPVLGLANDEKLERAIYNLMSNAVKFAAPGSVIDTKLSQRGNLLSFTVTNTHPEALPEQSFWNRYRREPAIEDSRFGLGLGMTLITNVASVHGGTVLISQPSSNQTSVTMTIAIKKDDSGTVHSPKLRISDYAGGRDKALLEFADILPSTAYEEIN